MKRIVRTIVLIAFLHIAALSAVFAAETEGVDLFETEAQVTTASRRLQATREAPVAVDIITREEIESSGAANIWDLMRFRVGMDVMEGRAGDGNRAIVSVRGFPREYVNNLQVLVDGRSVFSSYGGGVYWPQLPVQIRDIERIEIVRGPNAALYGSNAGLGVINIITKKPQAHAALGLEGQVGNLSTLRSGIAFERATSRFGLRLSHTYRNEDLFVPPSGLAGRDDILSNKVNLRGFWSPAPSTLLELFSGASWDKNTVPRGNEGYFRNSFGMLKLSHDLSQHSSFEIAASRAYAFHAIIPIASTLRFGDVDYSQTDVDAVHRFGWAEDRYQTTWGGNYRIAEASGELVFEGKPAQVNRTVRGFVQQSAKIFDPLTFVAAVSLERSDTGGTQPAYQAVALIHPVENHTFRISYSLAPTLPNLYEKGVNHLPSGFARIVGNPDLKPEKLKSYEAGYLGAFLARSLRLESNIFYMDITDLSASFTKTNPTPPPASLVSFSNNNEAIARGLEAKVSYWFSPGRTVYANYTFEKITAEAPDIMVEDATPTHKINLGGMTHLTHTITAGVNAGYKTGYTTVPANRSPFFIRKISPYWRLDTRLAYSPNRNIEVAIIGQNLLMPQHKEFSDFNQLEVPRTYYGSVALRF